MKLSDTQSLILSKAGQHEQRLAAVPQGLPAARDAVFRSMLKNGLFAECAAPREHAGLAWRRNADGAGVALRITDAGLHAAGVDLGEDAPAGPHGVPAAAPKAGPASGRAPEAQAARGAPGAAPDRMPHASASAHAAGRRDTLRRAAQAVLEAWDGSSDREALAGPMERLRAVLVKSARAAREPGAPRGPREGTKRERVLALLRRPEGASGPQLIEATGWAPHTVRGFLAGLQRKGIAVTVLERVRQVGPNKQGAKGSHSVYRAAEAG